MSKSVGLWEKKTGKRSFCDCLPVESAVFVVGVNIGFDAMVDFATLFCGKILQQTV